MMAATAEQYANWIVKNADKRGTKEFNTVVRAYEKAKQMQTTAPDAIPSARTPEWAQESPRLFEAASTARDVLGPAVEVALPTAGAVLGAGAAAPTVVGTAAGAAAGAGLGEGIAQEILYGADVALGRRPPRTGYETVMEPVSNVAFGATMEAAAPAVMRKLGGVADLFRGARTDIKARNLLRQSLTAEGGQGVIEPMSNMLRAGPEGLTARQVAAQADTSVFQALGKSAEQQLGFIDAYKNIKSTRVEDDIAKIADLAGGVTATELRAAQDAARSNLNLVTGEAREAALGRADVLGRLEPTLRAEASVLEEAASESVEAARRANVASEKARIRANQTDPNVWSQQYEDYMRQGIPDLAERQMKQAAEGSLEFGQAARMAGAAADSLRSAGVQPLEGKRIADAIRELAKDPRYAGMSERNIALTRVANDIEEWTNNQGIVDAFALDSIRKNSVNAIYQTTNLNPKAKAKAVAKTMSEIRPLLVDAIENAGGAGYREYLENYARGIDEIERKQLMGAALELYSKNPKKFVDLVEGNAPKTVEKIMGFKNYDISSVLDPDSLKVLQDAAQTIKLTQRSDKLVENTAKGLDTILRDSLPFLRLPPFLSAKTTVANEIIANLERKVGTKVLNRLGEAYKSGKSAADLLDSLTAYERFQLMTAISDPQISQMVRTGTTFSVPQTIEAANQLLTQPPENQNQLAR